MRFSHLRLRIVVDTVPGGSGIFNGRDQFAAPDYECRAESQFVRIRHVESGKEIVVHAQAVKEGVPATDEQQQPKQFSKHMQGGKR
jgi:hypothetical protein